MANRIASSPLLRHEFFEEVQRQLRLLIFDQFKDTDSIGPRSFAAFLAADPATESAGTHAAR